MKKTLSLVLLMTCFSAAAEDVTYSLKSTHNGNDYTIAVSYDTAAPNITNNNQSYGGWQEALTVPDAVIKVTYGDLNYETTGAYIYGGDNSWGKSLKVEAIQNPNGIINQVAFQIDADSNNAVMSPLENNFATDTIIFGGVFNLYLNEIGLYTEYYQFIDPSNTEFSKFGGSSDSTCSKIASIKNELSAICPDGYSCPPHIKDQIDAEINNLANVCK